MSNSRRQAISIFVDRALSLTARRFVALITSEIIAGLAFYACGFLELSLFFIAFYFIGSVHFRLLQSVASTLQAIAVFELGFLCGIATQDLAPRSFASNRS